MPRHWRVTLANGRVWREAVFAEAKEFLETRRLSATLVNEATGEAWSLAGGQWTQTAAPRPQWWSE